MGADPKERHEPWELMTTTEVEVTVGRVRYDSVRRSGIAVDVRGAFVGRGLAAREVDATEKDAVRFR